MDQHIKDALDLYSDTGDIPRKENEGHEGYYNRLPQMVKNALRVSTNKAIEVLKLLTEGMSDGKD